MSIFSKFSKKSKKEAVKIPATKVSLKYAIEKEEIHEELCRLAWQMVLGNAKYADARDVIQEGKAFSIPRDKISQLPVRDIRVHKHDGKTDYYFPDDLDGTPSSATVNGKILGCVYTEEEGVIELSDRDDAHAFVECLEQLYKMHADVEAGKKLPEEEPKEEDKKKSKSDKDGSEKGKKKSENKKDADQEDKEEEKLAGFPKCPLRDLYAELTDEEVLEKLKDKPRTERNDFFTDLKTEYDVAVEELQKYLQEFMDDLNYYATLIDDLNGGTSSAARRFIEEIEAQQKKSEDEKQEKKDSKGTKKEQEKSEEEASTLKNYVRRRKTKVNSWIRQAEAADNEELLKLLDRMKFRLEKEDIEGYKELEAEYESIVSADQQTNPNKDSSKGGNGKKGSGKKSDDSDEKPFNKPDGNGNDEANGEDSDGEGEEQEETSENSESNSDDEYTIADVLLALRLAGHKEIPKPIRIFSKNRKVAASDINEVLKSCGINDVKL